MDIQMITDTIKSVIDYIPSLIAGFRQIVINLTEKFSFPSDSYMLGFLVLAFVLSYFFIKQFITYSLFSKISTLLNWILFAIILYLLFVYI